MYYLHENYEKNCHIKDTEGSNLIYDNDEYINHNREVLVRHAIHKHKVRWGRDS